ncbi:MAG: sigma-54 dependent transcriptional regulator [Pseudomonadota bacterium]|nr:sigma-54 dependent transcriptional regulator [Pseudomonadota bacterium]
MNIKPSILICDDDPEMLQSLELSFKHQYNVFTADTVKRGQSLVGQFRTDVAIIDLNFEGQEKDGIALIDYLSCNFPQIYLIVLSGDKSVRRVIEATRRRLFDLILKEEDFFEKLSIAIKRVCQIKAANDENAVRKYLTDSKQVKLVLQQADRILKSKSDASILILGDTGTGKEFLAQHIAMKLKKKIVAANMASIPKETAESELFGHEKGAFTGAVSNKIGLFEQANDGIFFLDELGECSLPLQAKLLRVLQEKEVQPLGSTRPRKIKVRFIAATNCDLGRMVSEGSFRLDLLQRLNTFVFTLPSLRERPEDIVFYANLFLEEFSCMVERFTLAADGVKALLSHSWPGNIRELRNVIQRIVILSDRRVIDGQSVIAAVNLGANSSLGAPQAPVVFSRMHVLNETIKKEELEKALAEFAGNRRLVAQSLGVSDRTIYRWIRDFDIVLENQSVVRGIL